MTLQSWNWAEDFQLRREGVFARASGKIIPVSQDLARDFWRFLSFFVHVRFLCAIGDTTPFTVAFTPQRPRPWCLIWPVVHLAGGRIIADSKRADLVMHFEVRTDADPRLPALRTGAAAWNFECRSISKNAVSAAFERAFGYALAIDPERYHGVSVEKSNANATHDGRIAECPTSRKPGMAYQRVIDNTRPGGVVEDLRVSLIGGKPVAVFVKRRPVEQRFLNVNSEVYFARPRSIFTERELAGITDFSREIGLEWAGLDILRDAHDGRIYIVDANKTDLGPPVALGLRQKLEATRHLARALRDYIAHTRSAEYALETTG